jgi:RNA polymerase sigma factor (sigma-70 family)
MNEELQLIRKIISGDETAWRLFAEKYSPHIEKAIRNYVGDSELSRDLYASLLEKLKSKKLRSFKGKSTLATWLYVVTKNHCRDYFRSKRGIRHVMTALEDLSEIDRRFFMLVYIQRYPLTEAYQSLHLETRGRISYLDLFECRDRVSAIVAEKKLGRLLDRLTRPEQRRDSEFPEGVVLFDELQTPVVSESPPQYLQIEDDDLRAVIQNLKAAIDWLPHKDRLILKLRFEHKASAKRISEILDLANEKQVYRKLDGLIRKLREMLLEGDLPLWVYEEAARNIEDLCLWQEIWSDSEKIH